jgi:hypothetical protein
VGKEVSRDRIGEETKKKNGKRGVATRTRRSGEREIGERESVEIINGRERKWEVRVRER